MDKETSQLTERARRIRATIASEGWADVHALFESKLASLQNISTHADLIDAQDNEKLLRSLMVDKQVAETLVGIWHEILGTADEQLPQQPKPKDYIVNTEKE